MLEMALRAFTTFFATISPVDVAALYAILTTSATERQRRRMAIKGTFIATGLLLTFAVLGAPLLSWLGITLPALRTAGGILLLLLHCRDTTKTTNEENDYARHQRQQYNHTQKQLYTGNLSWY